MCDCVRVYNTSMRFQNTTLVLTHFANGEPPRISIPTEKIEKRGRSAIKIIAIYCPICGAKYEKEDDNDGETKSTNI